MCSSRYVQVKSEDRKKISYEARQGKLSVLLKLACGSLRMQGYVLQPRIARDWTLKVTKL